MDRHSAAALAIFITTLLLMIKRPHSISLSLAAGAGAAASLMLGTAALSEVAVAFLLGLMLTQRALLGLGLKFN